MDHWQTLAEATMQFASCSTKEVADFPAWQNYNDTKRHGCIAVAYREKDCLRINLKHHDHYEEVWKRDSKSMDIHREMTLQQTTFASLIVIGRAQPVADAYQVEHWQTFIDIRFPVCLVGGIIIHCSFKYDIQTLFTNRAESTIGIYKIERIK